jgi:ABC-type antimicrobial peptide transport system permease subunit
VLVGVGGALLINAVGINLKATVASAANGAGALGGPFGQGTVTTAGSTAVQLNAPLSIGLIVLAVALAVAGGLVAGAVGGLRAARLRPADALRNIE